MRERERKGERKKESESGKERERERERNRGGEGGERDLYTKRLSKQTSGCTCAKFSLRRRWLLDPRKHISDDRSRITDRWVLNHFIVR